MEWKKNKINVAVQVLPWQDDKLSYALVDKAIDTIKETGLTYKVCPFETVVECTYLELPELLEKIHEAVGAAGAGGMLTNLKIQVNFKNNVTIDDKMEKYW